MIRITKTMIISNKSKKKYYLNLNYREKHKARIEINEETYLLLPKILKTRSIREAILYLANVLPKSAETRRTLENIRKRFEKLERKFLNGKNIYIETLYLDDLDPNTQDMLLLNRYTITDMNTHLKILLINPFYADSVIEIIVSKNFIGAPEKYLEEKADLSHLNYARKALTLIIKTRKVEKIIEELLTALEKYVPLAKMLRKLEHKS